MVKRGIQIIGEDIYNGVILNKMVIFTEIRKLGYNKISFGKNNFVNMIC
jgi:hypothetical protein